MRDRQRKPQAESSTPEATTVLAPVKCKICQQELLIADPTPIVGDPNPEATKFMAKFLEGIMKHMNDAHKDLMQPSIGLAARFSHFLILQQFDLSQDPVMQEQYDLRRLQLLKIVEQTPDDAVLAQALVEKGWKLDIGLPVNQSALVKP